MTHPFLYNCEQSIEVYNESKHYLEDSKKIEKISELGWIYHSIGTLIPHTTQSFWSGHFLPWTESWDEIQISSNLCYFGFYKQSMISLRVGLELGLLSVYWNLNDDGHEIIQTWLHSNEDTPRLSVIWQKLEKHNNYKSFQELYDIKNRLLNLNYLHDYIHSRGIKFSNRFKKRNLSSQCFEQDLLERWLSSFEEVVIVLSILHLIKFPLGTVKYDYSQKFGIDVPSFGGLQIFEVERVEKVLGDELFRKLSSLIEIDEDAKSILNWIVNKPDITENEVENQIINQDKFMIEQMGLKAWIEQETKIFKDDNNLSISAKHKSRIDSLIKWAKDHGYDK